MGAQQSSGRGGGTEAAAPTQKTCYYELLAIDRQATDDEIKKAYRRKALELHPDRNLDNVAVATQKFAEVQSAYEVLSDPQERSWYDSHRDAILRGDDGVEDSDAPASFRNVRLTSTEEILSLMRRFNANIPFTDEPTGFYGIARETFEHLTLEEEAAADFNDAESIPSYPTFGQKDDDYEAVVRPFYSSWANFSTRKSFSWKDKYRLSDAPDRRVRRLMEKENKKMRDDAAREFNDAVRFLVSFVRKRDPRYLPNSQTESDRQKAMRDAAAAQAARSRAANQEKLASAEVSDWVVARDSDAAEDHFAESDEDESESEVEVLECVVCNKVFKSANQLEAHERSKKHIKAVQQLRRQMRKEGAELDLDSGSRAQGESEPKTKSKSKSKSQSKPAPLDLESEPESVNSHVSAPDLRETAPSKSAADGSGVKQDGASSPEPDADASVSDNDEYAPRAAVQNRLFDSGNDAAATAAASDSLDQQDIATALEETSINDSTATGNKKGKAKLKREKKAARNAQDTDTNRCGVCAETFTSRTKLFQHIHDEGHAAPVLVNNAKTTRGKKKR